jgi:hypothetical protein
VRIVVDHIWSSVTVMLSVVRVSYDDSSLTMWLLINRLRIPYWLLLNDDLRLWLDVHLLRRILLLHHRLLIHWLLLINWLLLIDLLLGRVLLLLLHRISLGRVLLLLHDGLLLLHHWLLLLDYDNLLLLLMLIVPGLKQNLACWLVIVVDAEPVSHTVVNAES